MSVHGKDGDAIVLEAVGGIEKATIGTQLYMRTTSCLHGVGQQMLYPFQGTGGGIIAESMDMAAQLADELGKGIIGREGDVSRSLSGFQLGSHFGSREEGSAIIDAKAEDAVATEVCGQ